MWFSSSIRSSFPSTSVLAPISYCPKLIFLFPAHIVAHRFLRRPHDGGPASPNVQARTTRRPPLWCNQGRIFDDDETILFISPALFEPSFGGRASISSFPPPFRQVIRYYCLIYQCPTTFPRRTLPFAFFASRYG